MSDSTTTATKSWAEQAREEHERERTATIKAQARARKQHLARTLPDILVISTLLIAAALTHGPVFGGFGGYVAALGGVALGLAVAALTYRLRLGVLLSIVALFLAYILFGGLIAVPQTTLYGVLPTLRTLQMLVVGTLATWKDLLTVQPPAGVFVGPAIMPYLSALLTAFLALTITLRSRRPLWALLPVAILLVTGILWGSQNAPTAPVLGIGIAVVALVWASVKVAQNRASEARGTVEFSGASRTGSVSRWVTSGIMVTAAVIAALAGNMLLLAGQHRTVLRDYVEPPLDLREYHSPASTFRHWNTTEKDTALFSVDGLAQGARVRLATLDHYDGTIFQIVGNDAGSGFRHVGTTFTDAPLPEGSSTETLSVSIGEYSGYWLPGVAATRALTFTSERASELAENLYYADLYGTGLSTAKLAGGDTYSLVNVTERAWSDAELDGKAVAKVVTPQDLNVPQALSEVAATLTANVEPGIEQVRAIENALHTKGFYSDGSDGLSLPGHRADRLDKFITADQMIGDDDQYAPAMALMLRSLGIPSRVVMGFYQDNPAGGAVTFTGKDTHLWVEVPFEGAGWVPFDPTPPKDQTPQTETPKPKPNPKPQVLQPPEPPEEPAEVPPDVVEEPEDDQEGVGAWLAWAIFIAKIAGISFLALSPLLLLIVMKALRRKRRRTKGREDSRAAGAWDEVIDEATDLGVTVTTAATRQEQARRIDAHLDGIDPSGRVGFRRYNEERTPLAQLAVTLDSAVFGEGMPDDDLCQQAWGSSKQAIRSIKSRLPWHRRLRALFSTRSLRARRIPLRTRIEKIIQRLEARNKDAARPAPRQSRKEKRSRRRKNNG